MLKKLALVLLVLGVLIFQAPTVQTADQQFVYKNAALTTASTVVTFGFSAQAVLVRNKNAAGGNVLYVDWAGGTVTSADDEIDPGAAASMSGQVNANGGVLGFGFIAVACATGTCNMIVTAIR